jgi:hypothetical protein
MSKKILIILASGPDTPQMLGTPFHQAMTALALDSEEVVIVFTCSATRLLKKEVAENTFTKPGSDRSIYDYIQETSEVGVKMYVCPSSLELHDMTMEDVVPEIEDAMGAAGYTTMALQDDVVTLTY